MDERWVSMIFLSWSAEYLLFLTCTLDRNLGLKHRNNRTDQRQLKLNIFKMAELLEVGAILLILNG